MKVTPGTGPTESSICQKRREDSVGSSCRSASRFFPTSAHKWGVFGCRQEWNGRDVDVAPWSGRNSVTHWLPELSIVKTLRNRRINNLPKARLARFG